MISDEVISRNTNGYPTALDDIDRIGGQIQHVEQEGQIQ
jgi:hypothetical protein